MNTRNTHWTGKLLACLLAVPCVLGGTWASAAPISFKIDIDSEEGGGGIDTAAGFTSLNAGTGAADGKFVTVGSTTFTIFSSDGSRSRSSSTDALTKDFIFDDGGTGASGTQNVAVGLRISGLDDGIWDAQLWAHDQDFSASLDPMIVGITQFAAAPETIFETNFAGGATNPYSFQFDSSTLVDGFGIFTRENNNANRTRFNGLTLTRVPEPGIAALLAIGFGLTLLGKRRRRSAPSISTTT